MEPISESIEENDQGSSPQTPPRQQQHQHLPQLSLQVSSGDNGGPSIHRIESRGSTTSGNDMTTGGETDFYSCNESEDQFPATPIPIFANNNNNTSFQLAKSSATVTTKEPKREAEPDHSDAGHESL